MIYDCFTFFNELDLLEIRLNVLNNVVDYFVLVEATKTHSGKDKPLYFSENKARFKVFEHKIIHIIVDDYPPFVTAWTYENHQRNAIMRGLIQAKKHDVIMISDLDEIPKPEVVKTESQQLENIKIFIQKLHYYYINYLNYSFPNWGLGTKMLPYRFFFEPERQLKFSYNDYLLAEINQQITPTKIRFVENAAIIKNAGWHFSYLGGVDAIVQKITRVCHLEFTQEKYKDKDRILKMISSGKDLFGRGDRFFGVQLDEQYPEYVRVNQNQYKHLIFEVTPNYLRKTWILKKYYLCKGVVFRFIVFKLVPRSLHPVLIKIRNLIWFGKTSAPNPHTETSPKR